MATGTRTDAHSLLDCAKFTSPAERRELIHEAHTTKGVEFDIDCPQCERDSYAQTQVEQ